MNTNVNPYFFRARACENCKSTCDLYENEYTGNFMCVSCLNVVLRQVGNDAEVIGDLPIIDINVMEE